MLLLCLFFTVPRSPYCILKPWDHKPSHCWRRPMTWTPRTPGR